MKHSNVAIFVPHNGCPHQCSFCEQREITGQLSQPSPDFVKTTLEKAVINLGEHTKEAEIAFFGGSFTAIERSYMMSLLNAAEPFLDYFKGIRLSTRPDYIDNEILVLLKNYNTTTIELGAQSMNDEVLLYNKRGHSSEDVRKSAYLIKDFGINLGLQMMTGLYKSTPSADLNTADEFITLNPDCVRIYPTVTMKNTELELLYKNGIFKPYSLDTSVKLCAEIINRFYENNIDVIRVGLHYSDSLVKNDVVGNYHPAFKELCESEIFYSKIKNQIYDSDKHIVYVNPKSLSKAIGQNRSNLTKLNNSGYNIVFKTDNNLNKYDIKID